MNLNNDIETVAAVAAANIPAAPAAEDSQQAGMAELQLEMSKDARAEAQERMAQITQQQVRKKEIVDAMHAAQDLRRRRNDWIHGCATQAQYKEVLEEYRQCGHGFKKGLVSGLLLKFCQSHGIKIRLPDNSQGGSGDTWTEALGVLEKMKAVNAVCDALHIPFPAAVDKETNQAEWDMLIISLQNQLDALGADIQKKMVQLQEAMGQYASHVQGTSSVLNQSGQR